MKTLNINLHTKIDLKFLHLAIGNFDGVHIGHQKIINTLVINAKKYRRQPAILSFSPHPRQYFSKKMFRYQLISELQKQKLLEKLGVEYYFLLNFDESIALLSPTEFIKYILVNQLCVEKLIVGHDFKFGKNREGDTNLLQDHAKLHGFSLEVIEPIITKNTSEKYSSSLIREALQKGDIVKTNLFLGRNWSMMGFVVHGDKKAREMNFPTANILPHQQIHPKKGVYAIQSYHNNILFKGIANFGERPTVDGNKLLLEVHLFEFNEDIYGKELTVEFLTFIRDEKKFDNFALLTKQIQKDVQIVKNYHQDI